MKPFDVNFSAVATIYAETREEAEYKAARLAERMWCELEWYAPNHVPPLVVVDEITEREE